jgi:hypothetical protein
MDAQKTKGIVVRSRGPWAVVSGQSMPGERRQANRRLPCVSFILLLAVCSLPFCPAQALARDGRWAILLSGSSGDPGLQERYLKELADLHAILEGPLGFSRDRITVLFDDPSKNPDLIRHKATKQNLQDVCRDLRSRVAAEDLVFVFIEGHGNYDEKTYKLNLAGPDPTAAELAAMLYSIPAKNFVVMNATSSSGGGLLALSRKGSILITATKSGMEKNLTHTGRFLVEAFKSDAADMDKSGRVSIIEAFNYALRNVEAYYQNEGNMQTEHPVLDDNGDAQARSDPTPENGEGLLARMTYLDAGMPAGSEGDLTPEQRKLTLEARDLEMQIEALKYAKSEMQEETYEKKLEELFLRLARINARLREESQIRNEAE